MPSYLSSESPPPGLYTLSLHDALPIWLARHTLRAVAMRESSPEAMLSVLNQAILSSEQDNFCTLVLASVRVRSEEHTSELQSQSNLVCRLLLEQKNALNASGLWRASDG